MSRSFEPKDCNTVCSYLDSYLSGELLVETNQDIINHISKCSGCSEELSNRQRVRHLLQRAVDKEAVPPDLEQKITRRIHGHSLGRLFTWRVNGLLIASASVVFLALIGFVFFSHSSLHDLPRAVAFAGRVTTEQGLELVNVGVQDHVACAIEHKMKDRAFTADQMKESLGPLYSGLLSVIQEKIPNGYTIVVGHHCSFNGHDYVHFILKNNHQQIVSVVLTSKPRPGFGVFNADPKRAATVYTSQVNGYDVASFETRDYAGFVISDLGEQNMFLGFDLAPSIEAYLSKRVA